MNTEETKNTLDWNKLAKVTGGFVTRCPGCGGYIAVPNDPDKAVWRYCRNCFPDGEIRVID